MTDEERPFVLVVDDDEDHLTMLELALETQGFEVATASSCERATRALARRQVDALVCDMTLGDGTAVDVLASVGDRRPRFAVVLSGFDGIEDRERTRCAGFDAHLVKPTSIDSLTEVLMRGLGRPRSEVRLLRPIAKASG